MNNQPAQTRPAHPVLATLVTVWNATFGLIIGPKGFFGPGFFSDFKEGCKKGTRPRVKEDEIVPEHSPSPPIFAQSLPWITYDSVANGQNFMAANKEEGVADYIWEDPY